MEETQLSKTNVNDMTQFLQTLIDSKKLPVHVKTVQDAFTIAQMGKELGFGTMNAFHMIIPIQGKLTLSAKGIGALLRKGGVTYQTLEDGVYTFNDGTVGDNLTRKIGDVEERAYGRRTKIKFTRDGIDEIVDFTWRDADLQGLTSKDNWKRMPKEMLFARCLAKGANRVGPDLLAGLYTTEEMVDTFITDERMVIRNEDGSVAEIKDQDMTRDANV